MEDVVRTVKDYVLETFLPDEDPANLTPSTPLITSGILDSLATLELVSFLEQRYAIELGPQDVDPSRLGTLSDIAQLVEERQTARQ